MRVGRRRKRTRKKVRMTKIIEEEKEDLTNWTPNCFFPNSVTLCMSFERLSFPKELYSFFLSPPHESAICIRDNKCNELSGGFCTHKSNCSIKDSMSKSLVTIFVTNQRRQLVLLDMLWSKQVRMDAGNGRVISRIRKKIKKKKSTDKKKKDDFGSRQYDVFSSGCWEFSNWFKNSESLSSP